MSNSGGDKTIPSSTTSTITSQITLTRGIWVVACDVRWDSSGEGKGIRYIGINGYDTPQSNCFAYHTQSFLNFNNVVGGISNAMTTQSFCTILRITATTDTKYLHVLQNSGSSLNTVYNNIFAYKLLGL